MKKMEKALIAVVLSSTLLVTGVSMAQENQNNSNNGNRGNGNSSNRGGRNRNSNKMMNGNDNMSMGNNGNMMMNGNANMSMDNSNMMMNGSSNMAMGSGMIGNITVEEFNRQNAQGAAAVAAITPDSKPLSKEDQKLMMEVAMGGMMQLQVSQAALPKLNGDEAKLLAQSEIDEQTGLGNKLKEIAQAKGMTMPAMTADNKTQELITKMNGMSGSQLDAFYVKESGVKGHEKLDKVMNKVATKAADSNLKAVESAAHPLVRTHLQVSQAVVSKMSGKGMKDGKGMKNGNMNSNMSSNSNR